MKSLQWKIIRPQAIGPDEEQKISETVEFPKKLVIVGNFAVALWILLDIIGVLLFNIVSGVVFLLVAVIGIYGILKFLGCLRRAQPSKRKLRIRLLLEEPLQL